MNATVCTERQRGADLLLAATLTNGHRDNFGHGAGFLKPHRLLHRNFTKRVDGHFDVI